MIDLERAVPDTGRRGATRIQGYWAGGERFDTLEEMLAGWHRGVAEREARLAIEAERRLRAHRAAKRRRMRARYGHDRPASTRRRRRRAQS